jgi:hypothetical protein
MIDTSARHDGVQVDLGWLSSPADDKVTLQVEPQGDMALLKLSRAGFSQSYPVKAAEAGKAITDRFGHCKVKLNVHDESVLKDELSRAFNTKPADLTAGYPTRV